MIPGNLSAANDGFEIQNARCFQGAGSWRQDDRWARDGNKPIQAAKQAWGRAGKMNHSRPLEPDWKNWHGC